MRIRKKEKRAREKAQETYKDEETQVHTQIFI